MLWYGLVYLLCFDLYPRNSINLTLETTGAAFIKLINFNPSKNK